MIPGAAFSCSLHENATASLKEINMTDNRITISSVPIEEKILSIRGQRIMLDVDLAYLYGVSTKRLNEQVRRNIKRFPSDFMFVLNREEKQEVVAFCDHLENIKYSKALPKAFTEHGAIMLANVLRSPRAIEMSVFIVRAFTKLRDVISRNTQVARKIAELEGRISTHDKAIQSLFSAIRELMSPQKSEHEKIGFDLKKT